MLQQLNLKIPAAVLADWRRRAREAGHGASVRDWLLSELAPAGEPQPRGGQALADRVAALEAQVSQLQESLAQLQALDGATVAQTPSGPGSAGRGNRVPSGQESSSSRA